MVLEQRTLLADDQTELPQIEKLEVLEPVDFNAGLRNTVKL